MAHRWVKKRTFLPTPTGQWNQAPTTPSETFETLSNSLPFDANRSPVNINLSIDDATGQLLTRLAEERGETRTALVRRAVAEWLERHQETPRWPEAIMEFKGTADMPLFEASRDKLAHPAADPLS